MRLSGKLKSGKSPRAPASHAGAGRWGRAERAFLVGIDYPTRARAGAGEPAVPPQARMARSTAATEDSGQPEKPRPARFSAEESLAELRELASSAGAELAGEFLQHRDKPDPATLIGRGKLQEISGAAASVSADLIIFDHELTPSQQR
ncbi:MAG TPA: hypothetical protein VJN48_01605, partial [Terriglobales bacterium]|nr:hypothetical protein [Terriglobales bacterium]